MPGTWPTSARSRSSRPSICPGIDPSSMPSFTSSRPLPPTRSTRSSPSATFSPAIVSKPQPENPLSGLYSMGNWNSGFLFAGQGVLDAANGVLDLALSLVRFAFRLELAVTGEVAGSFLQIALHLLHRAFGPIVAHGDVLGFAFLSCQ